MSKRSYVSIVLAVLCLGFVARAVPLVWSPLPATLDGFAYARLAADTLAAGNVPIGEIDADEFIFTLELAIASLLTGTQPLVLAQPLSAAIGGVTPVLGVLLVRALRLDGTSDRWLRITALLAGVALAFDGVFLRRSGVPDEEVMGLLLVPLLALLIHRWLSSGQTRWLLSALPIFVVFPLLHNFSAFHAVLTVTVVAALHAVTSRRHLVVGGIVATGFWIYFFGYFDIAQRLPMNVTYSGLIRGHLGLLSAWVILMISVALWIQTTSRRRQRLLYGLPIALWFGVLIASATRPVFPGTIPTSGRVLLYASGFMVFVALGIIGFPDALSGTDGKLVLGLVAGPATVVCYLLSAGLTPKFWDAVLRAQTFVHVGAVALACIGILVVARRDSRVGTLLVALLVLGALLTTPLGYMNLDTRTYPSTTLESEHAAVTFYNARMRETGTAADTFTRVDGLYFPGPPDLVEGPTRAWLTTGVQPPCPVLMQESWGTTGAHLYPLPPATVEHYLEWTAMHDRIYSTSGFDPVSIYLPDRGSEPSCGR